MLIFPAIDLYGGEAVRLYKGDYAQKTVYAHDPAQVARDFEAAGAQWIHLVDLEGAKSGETSNLSAIEKIVRSTGLKAQAGGGIRSLEVIRRYLDIGLARVILGTAAVTDPAFLEAAVAEFGSQIAVGVDIRDGYVAIRGWTEQSAWTFEDFCRRLQSLGVSTVISTDISRDGAMMGTNVELYRRLSADYSMDIIASGGVSSLEDVAALKAMGLYGAIIGKAYYTGAIDLRRAIEVAT